MNNNESIGKLNNTVVLNAHIYKYTMMYHTQQNFIMFIIILG